MADTLKTLADLLTDMPTGVEGAISAQDIRNLLVSYVHNEQKNVHDGYADSLHTVVAPQVMSAGVTYQLTVDGLGTNSNVRRPGDPSYWNTTTNLIQLPRLDENAGARLDMIFKPSSGSAGYIDFSGVIPSPGGDVEIWGATWPLVKTEPTRISLNALFYVGQTLIDDGLRFNMRPSISGSLYNKNITIFRL